MQGFVLSFALPYIVAQPLSLTFAPPSAYPNLYLMLAGKARTRTEGKVFIKLLQIRIGRSLCLSTRWQTGQHVVIYI